MKKISKEIIEAKKQELINNLELVQNSIKTGRPSPAKDFLYEIKEVLEIYINKSIPFTQISKVIYKTYNIKISTNILKSFAKSELGYISSEKNTSKKSIKKDDVIIKNPPVENKVFLGDEKQEKLSVKEMKELQAKVDLGDDSL